MNELAEGTLGISLVIAELGATFYVIRRWGIRGAFDGLVALTRRAIEGPPKPVLKRGDPAEIARLERELGMSD